MKKNVKISGKEISNKMASKEAFGCILDSKLPTNEKRRIVSFNIIKKGQ